MKYAFNTRIRSGEARFVSILRMLKSVYRRKIDDSRARSKVQWELKQVSEILSEKGINSKVTANSPVTIRLSPGTYAMVVAGTNLVRSENGGASSMRFREGNP